MTRNELETDPATSARLGRIRQKNTAPELVVRDILRSLGLRYRLSNRDLPGAPDVANRRARWAVFVHGCFWHAHPGCPKATLPKRNATFWAAKFSANKSRDSRAIAALEARGYVVVVVWECELKIAAEVVRDRLRKALVEGARRPRST